MYLCLLALALRRVESVNRTRPHHIMIDDLKNDLTKNILEDDRIFKASASVPADGGVMRDRIVYIPETICKSYCSKYLFQAVLLNEYHRGIQ